MIIEYKNEPFTDFSLPENKIAMETALAAVQLQKAAHYPTRYRWRDS
jgi:1-pyrroline-5-carboxylate dehydrogenase